MAAARDTRGVIWDPRRFWPRRGRRTDAPDLAIRLAVRPKGWAEHLVFWISGFVGALGIVVAATEDIKEPLAFLAVFALGTYFLWSGWSAGRQGYSLKDRAMLLQGEVFVATAVVAAAVMTGRRLFG